MYTIHFKFDNNEEVKASAAPGEKLLDAARKAKIAIDAPCSGNGTCGKCKVKLLSGDLKTKHTHHMTQKEYDEGWRLACLSEIASDIEIMIPDTLSAFKSRMKVADLSSPEEKRIFQRMKQSMTEAGISQKNSMEILELVMDEPSFDDTMPDNERFTRAIQRMGNKEKVRLSYFAFKKLSEVLRASQFQVKVIIARREEEIYVYDVFDVREEPVIAGAAIDLGTTSVAAVLIDMLTGEILAKGTVGNAQIRYGADVINRILASGKSDGKETLQKAVVEDTIHPLLQTMCAQAGIRKNSIYRCCVAGNTTMNHFMLGLYADPIRLEPYIPSFFQTDPILASDVGIWANPNADIRIAPNIGSYVGGDITAGVFASMIWNNPKFSLLIDLGTNGELVFGNEDFLISCACSAGPAFEGGDISCGMRATESAIEACTIEENSMEPSFRIVGDGNTKPMGLCGSGLIDIVSELFRCKIINPKGKFIREGERIKRDEYGVGRYILAFEQEAGIEKNLEITEIDIDNFIRAKGAVFSAIRIMLNACDLELSMIENVYVAGGIGSGINIKNAIQIGLFPNLPIEMYHYIGNSSLSGAYAMLFSEEAERKIYDLSRNMTYIELSTLPQYMDEFVGACFLPHTDLSCFKSN